jgi:hypothetical protein
MVYRKYTRKKGIQQHGGTNKKPPRPAPPPPPGADQVRAAQAAAKRAAQAEKRAARQQGAQGVAPTPTRAAPAPPLPPPRPPAQGVAAQGVAPQLPRAPPEPSAKAIGLAATLPFIGLAGATVGTAAALPKMAVDATILAPIGVAGTILQYPLYKYSELQQRKARQDLEKLGGYNINQLQSKLDKFNANIEAVKRKQQTMKNSIEEALQIKRFIYPSLITRKQNKYTQQLQQLENSKKQYLNSEIERHKKRGLTLNITNNTNTNTKKTQLLSAMETAMREKPNTSVVSYTATELARLSAATAKQKARLEKSASYVRSPFTSLMKGLQVGKNAMSLANSTFVSGDATVESAASKKKRVLSQLSTATGITAARKFFTNLGGKSGQQVPVEIGPQTSASASA